MKKIPVALALADYVRLLPLAARMVDLPDVDLTLVLGRGGSWPDRARIIVRALTDPALSGGEASMGQHLRRIDKGDRSFVALPVFPLRCFVARDLYIKRGGPISQASDLKGKKVGIYNWFASGGVWYRHFQNFLGVGINDVEWVVGDVEDMTPVAQPLEIPAGIEAAPADRYLSDMVAEGEIAAMWSPPRPRLFERPDSPLARLFADMRPIEKRYFLETNHFPAMHHVVIRRELYEAYPWILRSLTDAFIESNELFDCAQRKLPYASPWMEAELDETLEVMGPRFYTHGLDGNVAMLQAFNDQASEAGLVSRRISVNEVYQEYLSSGTR